MLDKLYIYNDIYNIYNDKYEYGCTKGFGFMSKP